MTTSETGPQVEFVYALHGGEPFTFAACSFEDLKLAADEAADVDDSAADPGRISPSTRHFYERLGQLSGLGEVATAAMDHYDGLISASREAFIEKLRNPE